MDALNQSKVTVKTFIMLPKISISNRKCCWRWSRFPQKIWSCTVFNIDDHDHLEMFFYSWAANQHIRMIFLKDHVTLKIQLCITWINCILQYITIQIS